MSYSAHRRNAADQTLPIRHRISHLRSCALHVSWKWKCHRTSILGLIGIEVWYQIGREPREEEIQFALAEVERLRWAGPPWSQPTTNISVIPGHGATGIRFSM